MTLRAPPTRLAAVRIAVVAFALASIAAEGGTYLGLGGRAATTFEPVGLLGSLPRPLPAAGWYALLAVLYGSGAAFLVGARPRVSGPLFALALLLVTTYRSSWSMLFHSENLIVLHVGVLALTRSCDAYTWGGREPRDEDFRYAWPLLLLGALTTATYFVAAVAKLRIAGPEWVTGDVLVHQIGWDNLRKAELGVGHSPVAAALLRHPQLFPPLAGGALLVELAAPLALLGPRMGRVWAAAAWLLHLGIAAVMWITFAYPLLGIAYLSFFRCERPAEALRRRCAARGRIEP